MDDIDFEEVMNFVRDNEISNVAEKLLFVLGFKSNLFGTRYLIDGIVLRYAKENASLCKELYPEIAQKYNTTASRVERGIRHCISGCYESGNLSMLNQLFHCNIVSSNYSPTNSELISSICTAIHIEKEKVRKTV